MSAVKKALQTTSVALLAIGFFAISSTAHAAGSTETGLAAVYSTRLSGHKTASGKIYRPSAMTMAHKTLPFGTKVKVTNKANGKSIVLTVTDRGPRQAGRVADVSSAAGKALGIGPHRMSQVELNSQ